MKKLLNRSAIITGGTKGIGRSIALGFVKEGANVCIAARSDKNISSLLQQLKQYSEKVKFIKTDMGRKEDIINLVNESQKFLGSIDILVNNAAICTYKDINNITEEDWDLSMNINLKAYWLLSKISFKYLKKSKNASIINLSSIHGNHTSPNTAPYTITKSGIIGLTRCIALDYGKFDIRANCILPGLILTDKMKANINTSGKKDTIMKKIFRNECLGRPGKPEDIAGATVFLASDDSKFITASSIYVDGGANARLYGNVFEEISRKNLT